MKKKRHHVNVRLMPWPSALEPVVRRGELRLMAEAILASARGELLSGPLLGRVAATLEALAE